MLFSKLINTWVIDVNANIVGTIIDIELNISQNNIRYFIISIYSDKKECFTFDEIEKIGDSIILKIPREKLNKYTELYGIKNGKIRFNDLKYKQIIDISANRLGEIEDVEIDLTNNKISKFICRGSLTFTPDDIKKIGQYVFLKI